MGVSNLQKTLGWATMGLASLSTAQFTFSPGGPTYSIGIPSGSSISSSSTGPLYFHIEAPTSYQWVALGIGSQMAGSSIFVMYTDGNGNITLSGRKGTGQVEPKADSTLQAGLVLLAGTGIVDGKMVANVRCTSCKLQSDASASDSPWIAAWSTGSAINSASKSATLRQHSGNSRVEAQVDLSKASISSDSNPFISGGATTPSNTGSGSSPPSNGNPTGPAGNGGNGNSNAGGITIVDSNSDANAISDYQKAHGIVASVVVILLFPLASMFMRMGGNGNVHAILQVVSLFALLVGLGLGVKLANLRKMDISSKSHTIFGMAIVVLFLLQPIFGIMHHKQYKRNFARARVSHLHIWYGRILMALAVLNGGLGFKLAANAKNGEIAYAVIAGVVGITYIAMCIFKRKGGPKVLAGGRKNEGSSSEGPGVGDGQGGYAMPEVGHYRNGNGHTDVQSQNLVFK
ncbi:hypothetical protein VTL71DRAFT_10223 [Oculimacula yallundae]|uniref:DOMON domain-containing protein n=1 Tax=Oculimacula yallundae TaxID=86028 RepID=A0ABR4BRI3_9HELO